MAQSYNYPKHPLFGIAPILYNWRGDPRHDEYTSHLVGRIRAGRYTSDLWDCNSLYLTYPERAPIAADKPRIAVKSRYVMTPEERRAWNNSYNDPELNAERARRKEQAAKRKAERAAWEREQKRLEAEHKALEEAKAAETERRDAEWRERDANILAERKEILTGRWECSFCLRPAEVSPYIGLQYVLGCRNCGRRGYGSHERLMSIVNAKKAA